MNLIMQIKDSLQNSISVPPYKAAAFFKTGTGHYAEGYKFKKIMLFGRPGSGKSTFAHKLAEKTGLPLHHLDKHFFISGWIEQDTDEFMRIQEKITNGDAWIIDGNSTRSLETRWSRADLVLYFNYGKVRCLIRLIKRIFTKPAFIDDRAPDCPEVLRFRLIKYMWTFENRVKGAIAQLKLKYKSTRFIEIHCDDDLKQVEAMIWK
jgi:adenylate kinase family enzyme